MPTLSRVDSKFVALDKLCSELITIQIFIWLSGTQIHAVKASVMILIVNFFPEHRKLFRISIAFRAVDHHTLLLCDDILFCPTLDYRLLLLGTMQTTLAIRRSYYETSGKG
jgi:hypothetical protein